MLPKTLKYGSKIESAYARSMRSNIQPQNGTGPYNLGDTIIINIPTRNNLVLVPSESYLKFNVNITSGTADNAFRWDSCGSHSCIQRIRIFHGSNIIQDVDNYGMLAKILFDLQMPTDATYGKYNLLCGTRADTVLKVPTITPVPAAAGTPAAGAETTTLINVGITATNASLATLSAKGISVNQVNSGERIGGDGALNGTGAVASQTYCLSLISLVGVLCSQNYIPLFEMTSAPLRVEIQLVDQLVKACNVLTNATAVSTATLSNVEYIGNFIELGDPAVAMIKDSLGGAPLQFVVPDYRNYVYNYTMTNAAAASIAMPIAAKFSSVKAIFISVRDQNTGAASYFPFSSVTRNISDYQFRIGPNVFPPKAPATPVEMFAECLKAIGSISDINQQPSIDKASYTLINSVNTAALLDTASSVSNQYSGSFYIGIDLENYANAPKDQIFTGYNTNTEDIYAMLNFGTQTGGNNVRFDAFCNFDCVLICENQTAYIRF
jgi:hypothetical protein